MRYGIMGAMPEEVDSLHEHMTQVQEINHGGRTYYLGKIKGQEVVLVFSRWGKVAAAATATSLITEFEVDKLIFTGIAGAVDPSLNIGDVIISEQLYQHDMDARPLFKKHQIPLTDTIYIAADKELREKAWAITQDIFASLQNKTKPEILAKFNISKPVCRLGVIATGDQFINSIEKTQALLTEVPHVTAVEMEGAAVAQVCQDYQIPFVVIRTISDKADHQAHFDFVAFINDIARHYAEYIVLGLLES